MEKEEEDAIRRVLAGDRDSYRVLMDRHFAAVYRVAYRITGDEHDAEEAAQEAFLRGYNKLSTFRLDAQFATWMTRIAMNTSINFVERRTRDVGRHAQRVGDTNSAVEGTVAVANAAAGPDQILFDAESASLRERAMDSLTPMERTAFVLRHMEDQPMAEIAAALNVPVNSVKQAVFRAVGKLRQSLALLEGGL